jgi:hypothetical protein
MYLISTIPKPLRLRGKRKPDCAGDFRSLERKGKRRTVIATAIARIASAIEFT